MRSRFDFLHRLRFSWSALIVAAILALSEIALAQPSSANAQTAKPTATEQALTQIKQDTEQASVLSRKLDKQIRRLRTLVAVSLAFTVVTLIFVAYLTLQKRPADQKGTTSAGFSVFQWDKGSGGLARIRRRQRKLARAVADLQEFADQSRESNSELSVLLDSVRKRLTELDAASGSSPLTAATSTVTPAAKS